MENQTIDPIIIIKTNNSLVRHSDSVWSVWLSCIFCLNGIQFSSVQCIFIYIASAAIKILSWRFLRSQSSTPNQQQWRGKTPFRSLKGKGPERSINTCTGENKLVPVNKAKWAPLQSISHEASTAVKHYRCKCVWVRPVFQQDLQDSICLHTECKNTDWHTSHSLRSSLTTS